MTPLHPQIVHFPVALIVTAAVIDLVALGTARGATLRRVATGLYLAGAATLLAAYLTGRNDAELVRIPGPAHVLVDEHWDWALRTTIYMGAVALVRAALEWTGRIATRTVWLPIAAISLAALLLLYQTAERGGRLVYEHGVAVAAPR